MIGRKKLLPTALGALLVCASPVLYAAQGSNSNLQSALNKALSKKQFSNVHATVNGNMAVLKGTVSVYSDKEAADKKAQHVKGISSVQNEIQVSAGEVSDQQLQNKLLKAVEYDRVGYGTTAFNAISVQVHNGVVRLGGHAFGPVDASSAVSVASNMKGVRDVIDDIQVDPLSPMDNRIRLQAYRTIYGFPSLNKYAINPGKPIRISVQNGHLTLYGAVDSQADKNAAGIRAKTVPGVFSVTNDLHVANGGENGSK